MTNLTRIEFQLDEDGNIVEALEEEEENKFSGSDISGFFPIKNYAVKSNQLIKIIENENENERTI